MRLRDWVAVLVSVALLEAAGFIGIEVNASALRAADQVHRADTRALGVNNATLTRQLQLLSASELSDFLAGHPLRLGRNSRADRRALDALVAKSSTFSYGAAITDLAGTVLTASRRSGLPAAGDPGWRPLRAMIAAGGPGFSSIMTVAAGVHLEAVAVPVMVKGSPAGLLIGFDAVARSELQNYLETLRTPDHTTMIVDAAGAIAATADAAEIGRKVDPAIQNTIPRAGPSGQFVEFTAGRTDMIAIVVGGLPAGWAYVRMQTKKSFDGAVHARSQTLAVTLLVMLLIGVAAVSVLGYRVMLQRRRADERFQALVQHAPDLVSVLDGTGRIIYASPSAGAALGYEAGQLTGSCVFEIVHPQDRPYMLHQFDTLLGQRGATVRLQCRVRSSDGDYRWFEFTASNQMDNPALAGVVINARDISANRAFQERLAHEADHDALTGLPNRRRMHDALRAALSAGPVAVLFVDLDGFKPVNDAHGHDAGDELLRQVAGRLRACVRENDLLARVGGDEFVILMPGVGDETLAQAMSDRIADAIGYPFQVAAATVLIGASVGIHLATASGDPDDALRAADHAMYTIKKAGRGHLDRALALAASTGRHRAEP